jgi:probable HAF family extracellular repeat protein
MRLNLVGCGTFLLLASSSAVAAGTESAPILLNVPDSQNAEVRAINNRGEVVGLSYSTARQFQVFYWSQASGVKVLGIHSNHTNFTLGPSINDSGVVAASLNAAGWEHAFRWTVEDGLVDLGVLAPPGSGSLGGDAAATAINKHGDVAGFSTNNQGFSHAVIWTRGSAIKDLGTLGGHQSWAYDLNDNGDVTGTSMLSNGLSHCFIWNERSGMQDLGVPTGYQYSSCSRINGSGDVVGTATNAAGNSVAIFYNKRDGMIMLNPQGTYCFPQGFNDHGEVLIASGSGSTVRAFLWTQRSGFVDLGTLGATYAYPWSLNERGEVVGASTSTSGTSGFVWSAKDGMHGLDAGSAFFPLVINDHGDIAGYTGQKAFVLLR